jgi:AdoMet-dependent rRNA methyltransferase SPB1
MRMQLQMTAPLDIGMEFADDALKGDVFDLTQADGKAVVSDSDSDVEDGDGIIAGQADSAWDKDSDGGDDGERKISGLEDELDGMYERYRERLAERDLKFKAKEARQKDRSREEWAGVKKDDDEGDAESGDESEEGGWDVTQAAKGGAGDDASSSDSDSEEEVPVPKKRKTETGTKLITKLEEPKPKGAASKAAQVWFSQDLFKGVADGGIEDTDESQEEEEMDDESEGSEDGDEDEQEAEVTPNDHVSMDDYHDAVC